jgi:hypothetical protein
MSTPFTAVERAKIRWYLGWSARFHQADSRLEQAMNAVDMETTDATHDLITAQLTAMDAIGTKITQAYDRLKALKVGSIDLPGHGEIGMLRSEGRRLGGQLAAALGVETRPDVWSGTGNKSFAGWNGLEGGNTFRHG